MKKILFVIHALEYGGAERSLVNLLNELPQDKYAVDLLLFQRKGDFLAQLPTWVHVLDTPEAIRGLYAPLTEAKKHRLTKLIGTACARVMRRTRKSRSAWRWRHFYRRKIKMLPTYYDTVVAFTGSEILYFVADRVQADRKLVFIHNDYRTAGYSAKDDAPYLAQMDAIISISKQCVEVLKEEFPALQERMYYLENINSSAVIRARAEAFTPVEYEDGPCRILSVGRLWPQKGFDLAVDAAAILKERGLDFRWHIVGEGSLREELQKQIDTLGLTEVFFLLGTRENPYPYMKYCDVLVQSSRYEGKSVVLDEAKMLCKPIVATAYPTVADQVIDGCEGIVTEMSAEKVANGVLRMVQDTALRERITAYLAEREYGNQSEVNKYMQLLDE